METLIRKYLDGELDDREAQDFLEALAADPQLEQEVRSLEEVMAAGADLASIPVAPDFSRHVMGAIRALEAPVAERRTPRPRSTPGWRALPLAASWVLAVGLGYVLSGGPAPFGGTGSDTLPLTQTASRSESVPRAVRLVYAPPGGEVGRVRVAGSFNDWQPDRTPMRNENGLWVVTLLLPPDSYEYMFVADDDTWVTDPLATLTRDDGFGSRNAVLEIGL